MSETIKVPEIVKSELFQLEQDLSVKNIEGTVEREHVHEVIGERIEAEARTNMNDTYVPPQKRQSIDVPAYLTPEIQPMVQELINVAFSKGFEVAIKEVIKTGDVALVDAFHDAVTDELFNALKDNKQIEELAA